MSAQPEWISVEELRALIKARFAITGQPSQFATSAGLSDESILAFLRGKRPCEPKLLAALGWERQIVYRRVEPCRCYVCTLARVDANPIGGHPKILDHRLAYMFLCETLVATSAVRTPMTTGSHARPAMSRGRLVAGMKMPSHPPPSKPGLSGRGDPDVRHH